MELEREEMRRAVRHGYQILVRIEAELLLAREKPKICAFYKALAQACVDWAYEDYGGRLREEFSALEGIKERTQFQTQSFRFWMRRCFEDDRYIAFVCETAFVGRWRGTGEDYRRLSHVWSKEEELILPPAQILSAYGLRLSKKDLPFPPDGIYPEGDGLIIFRNATEMSEFLEKRFVLNRGEKESS